MLRAKILQASTVIRRLKRKVKFRHQLKQKTSWQWRWAKWGKLKFHKTSLKSRVRKITTPANIQLSQFCQEAKCLIQMHLLLRRMLLQRARPTRSRTWEQLWWRPMKEKVQRGREKAASTVEQVQNWVAANKTKLSTLKSSQTWDLTWWKMPLSKKMLESHQSHLE